MRAIIRNNKVSKVVQGNSGEGLPVVIKYNIPEPSIFYHVGTPKYSIFDNRVEDNRVVSFYPLDYCKTLVKKELKKRREEIEFGGFEHGGEFFESDRFSLVMMALLPPSVKHFKTKGKFLDIANTQSLKQATIDHIQNSYSWEGVEAAKVDTFTTHQEVIDYYTNLVSAE